MILHLDFETRSVVDLREVGAHKYAQDPSTDVWCAAYATDDEEVDLWHPDLCSIDLFIALKHAELIVAHNAPFERAIAREVMSKRYGWPDIPLEKWRCTMAMCYAQGLPGSLDQASAALGLTAGKDAVGHRLMLAMCKPRAVRKNEAPGVYWRDDEASRLRLFEYCRNDVAVERMLEKRLLPLSDAEQQIWFLDQRINDRGVLVDKKLCRAAKKVVADATVKLDKEMSRVTKQAVTGVGNVIQLTTFLRERGVQTDSVAKDKVEELLVREDLPVDCQRALELRQEGGLTSVSKFDAFLNSASEDGRARGLLQYHAASTGRWGGRRVQPQNFKRPGDEESVPEVIETVLSGDHRRVELFFGPVLPAVSDCLRGVIRAAPGHIIRAADLANIEGRVLAWLAGEKWKLEAFRDFDKGVGEDCYKIAYANAFNLDARKVTKPQRQIGKPIELALGYEGGPGAFQVMAKTYRVDISASYAELTTRFGAEAEKAEKAFKDRGKSSGMGRATWVAAEIVKLRWRARNPNIVTYWRDMKEAAVMAVLNPRSIITCGKVKFRKSGSFLFMRLPSITRKRNICFPYPEVKDLPTPWGTTQATMTFMTIDSYAHKWQRVGAYGGMLANYATQGTARDVMVEGMLRVEAAGYDIVLTVHDEIVTETPLSHGSTEELEQMMAISPAWAPDLPIAAGGFSAERYKK